MGFVLSIGSLAVAVCISAASSTPCEMNAVLLCPGGLLLMALQCCTNKMQQSRLQPQCDLSCSCRFANCQHIHEPGCVVRGDWERYPFYLEVLEEVKAKDERERHRSASKKVSLDSLGLYSSGHCLSSIMSNLKVKQLWERIT